MTIQVSDGRYRALALAIVMTGVMMSARISAEMYVDSAFAGTCQITEKTQFAIEHAASRKPIVNSKANGSYPRIPTADRSTAVPSRNIK